MGGYKWGLKSPNLGYKYSYPTYNSTHEPPRDPEDCVKYLRLGVVGLGARVT